MHPHLFHIPLPWGGTATVASYGAMMMLGFLVCLYLLSRRGPAFGLSSETLFDIAIAALIGGVVGARIYYIIYAWDYFAAHPAQIVRIDKGGLVFYGGVAGGTAGVLLFTYLKELPLRRTADVFAGLLPLGHAFGRMGCFLNGCCYGKVTQSWLGMRFPPESAAYRDMVRRGLLESSAAMTPPLHPTQLYAVGYNLAIFGVLSWLLWNRRREGDVVWTYLAVYGVARFLNEFLRNDQAAVASGLTTAQLVCIAFVIVGGTMLLKSWTREPDPLPDVSP
ncbi:MAG: prolipoprotein diacylglyceryl transferase [Planctomycetota bacterium]